MPRRGGTDELIERLQEEFNIDDLDETGDVIYRWLTKGKLGPHRIRDGFSDSGKQRYTTSSGLSIEGRSKIRNLAAQFGESKRIYNEAGSADNIEDLDELKKEARGLIFRRGDVTDFIELRKKEIQLSIDESINADIENVKEQLETTETEKEDISSERLGIQEQRIALQQEEGPKGEIELLESEEERLKREEKEREVAMVRLRAKIQELTRSRGRKLK